MAAKPVTAAINSKVANRRPSNEHVWVALAHCYKALSTAIEQSLLHSGLSLTDFMLLEALLHKGSLTITAIQASVLLATGSMTAAVDRLEKQGLIIRKPSATDRRARFLELTGEGKRVISTVYKQHSQDLKRWLGVLSAEDRANAFQILRKLERHVKNSGSAEEAL
jgi:MarR family 2-MHQ and catechol resistance regulon transcriptional repressor